MGKSSQRSSQSPETDEAIRAMKEEELIDFISSNILPSLTKLTDRLEAYVCETPPTAPSSWKD